MNLLNPAIGFNPTFQCVCSPSFALISLPILSPTTNTLSTNNTTTSGSPTQNNTTVLTNLAPVTALQTNAPVISTVQTALPVATQTVTSIPLVLNPQTATQVPITAAAYFPIFAALQSLIALQSATGGTGLPAAG